MTEKLHIFQDPNTFQVVDRYNEEKAIYSSFGDTRINCYEMDPDMQVRAQSIACLILTDHIHENSGKGRYTLKGDSLAQRLELGKPGDKVHFAKEPSLGMGTAFLVAPQLALTAGHCVCKQGENTLDYDRIQKTRIVFGFQMVAADTWNDQVETSNVRHFEVLHFRNMGGNGDWALLGLDQEVSHIKPLPVNFTNIVTGTPDIYMLGHPSGLPLKLAKKGVVQLVPNPGGERFSAKITAYGGNSGSPVFDAKNHEVIGILVAGNCDFEGSTGNMSDHVVTPGEILYKGFEKCQRTSALIDDVIQKISSKEAMRRKQADTLHDKAIEALKLGQRETAFETLIASGDLGLRQSYLRAVALSPDGQLSFEIARKYSESFYHYLTSTEASAEGIRLDDSAKVFVISQSGGKVSTQNSHYGSGSVGMLEAKEGGQTSATQVTTGQESIVEAQTGREGKAKANGATLGNHARLTVLANVDDETAREAIQKAKEAMKRVQEKQGKK
ncbi:MAG: trypsin-like peptidase domain-containing protein [Simkania sp.]|nr:trypsin-like peptidase domain-containing protein [Simkania sp.]